MLIIAMPKSASTSLLTTLCRLHGMEDRTRMIRRHYLVDLPIASDYSVFFLMHADMRELDSKVLSLLTQTDNFCKLHLPPTENNQCLLRAHKKVILLRRPEGVIGAYKRGEDTGVFPMKSLDFVFCVSEEEWLRKARQTGLLKQMQMFYEGWMQHKGDKLLIHYEELISRPRETIRAIEAYWDLPLSEEMELDRKRYTRLQEEKRQIVGQSRMSVLLRRTPRICKRLARDLLRGLGWKPNYAERFKRKLLAEPEDGLLADR
ncbi:MAG TPA: sulfotransferase domain-containing protein [Anaerohalosphaeraceae bacterium]|nr:sulfotransferase domain-containing protein [Anaerohalosphaeraceae bacterium]